jgi:hypothetical protein
MVLIKILKRRDAASLVIAIIIAMAVGQALATASFWPASVIVGTNQEGFGAGGPGWEGNYLQPFIQVALQIIALEIIVRLYVAVAAFVRK